MNRSTKCLLVAGRSTKTRENLSLLEHDVSLEELSARFRPFGLAAVDVTTFLDDIGIDLRGSDVDVYIGSDEAYEQLTEVVDFFGEEKYYFCKISSQDPEVVQRIFDAFMREFDAMEITEIKDR